MGCQEFELSLGERNISMSYLRIAGAVFAAFVAGQAMAQDTPSYVNINSITAAGSGCPIGTIGKNISADRKAFTLTFSEYLAEVYPGSTTSDSRRNCTFTIDLDFPTGWTYSLVSFDYRGYLFLDSGVTATSSAKYYFQSDIEGVDFNSSVSGPADQDYHFRDQIGLGAVIWSPDCTGDSRALNIQSSIRVSNQGNPQGEGVITTDSFDGEFNQSYGIIWKRCGGSLPPIDEPPPYDSDFPEAPADLTIENIQYNGSGCPIGTIAENVSPDKKAFTLIFDSFIAEAGPGISRRENRKNCQIIMDLDYDSNQWSFALATFDYRGYLFLEDGVTARQSARYYLQGQQDSFNQSQTISGFADEDYMFRHVVPVDALAWSPCGPLRALNINSAIRVNNSGARNNGGFVTVDSVDGEFKVYHALVWRRCN